jgi:hypothetical protein
VESDDVPIRDVPTQVKVVVADATSSTEGVHTNEALPQLEDGTRGNLLVPGSLRGLY